MRKIFRHGSVRFSHWVLNNSYVIETSTGFPVKSSLNLQPCVNFWSNSTHKMVSTRTLQQYRWAVWVAYYVGALPVLWNNSKGCLEMKFGATLSLLRIPYFKTFKIPYFTKFKIRMGLLRQFTYLVLQVLNIIFAFCVLFLFKNVSELDKQLFLILLFPMSMCLSAQMMQFQYAESWWVAINEFHRLDLEIRKHEGWLLFLMLE